MKIGDDFVQLDYTRRTAEEMTQRSADYYKLMNTRRTVREFSSEAIPDEVINNAILAAGTAPSGAHMQPWFFCVVKDPAIKTEIRKAAEHEETINYASRFPQEWLDDLAYLGTDNVKEYLEVAPALIVVFKQAYREIDGQRRKNYYVNESVGIAAGMLIAALHNAGVATLTHTPSPMGFLNNILKRPRNETPILLMPVGYPKEGTRVPDLQRKTLDAIMQVY